eukprot:3855451-Amphidinium_carterae.4
MSLILGGTTLCDWCAAALTPLRRRSHTSLCFCVPSSLTLVSRAAGKTEFGSISTSMPNSGVWVARNTDKRMNKFWKDAVANQDFATDVFLQLYKDMPSHIWLSHQTRLSVILGRVQELGQQHSVQPYAKLNVRHASHFEDRLPRLPHATDSIAILQAFNLTLGENRLASEWGRLDQPSWPWTHARIQQRKPQLGVTATYRIDLQTMHELDGRRLCRLPPNWH